ncbi:hypothetical protein FQN60_010578 [Etheostoma spectabile]|uniref:Uncharacterized protein n=1 Tax=Etheostoma spectabile TaxID=54343 RepID=A0A5J5CA91_9PERO|nr:hypothetical protein FQN60_010578 [Etheostoma spectabile]
MSRFTSCRSSLPFPSLSYILKDHLSLSSRFPVRSGRRAWTQTEELGTRCAAFSLSMRRVPVNLLTPVASSSCPCSRRRWSSCSRGLRPPQPAERRPESFVCGLGAVFSAADVQNARGAPRSDNHQHPPSTGSDLLQFLQFAFGDRGQTGDCADLFRSNTSVSRSRA